MRNNLKVLTSTAQGYHIGLIKDYDDPNLVILQASRDKDSLSPELWKYLGRRLITKKQLKHNKEKLLAAINEQYGTNFTKMIII